MRRRRGSSVPGRVEQVGGDESRPDEADWGDALWCAGAVQGEQHDGGGPGGPDLVEVRCGQRRRDRDGQRIGVLLAHLGRAEVQPPEGAVGGRGEGRQLAMWFRDARSSLLNHRSAVWLLNHREESERKAFGVDQLDCRSVGELGREGQGDARVGDVEGGAGGECAGEQQLEIVQLARAGAVLRCGHRAIVPDRTAGYRRAHGCSCGRRRDRPLRVRGGSPLRVVGRPGRRRVGPRICR